jgi:hypothetical protein
MHYKLEDADLMNVVVSRADVDWISLCGMYCIANTGACMQDARVIYYCLLREAWFGPVDPGATRSTPHDSQDPVAVY